MAPQLVEILRVVHAKGVVHRDLSLSNIYWLDEVHSLIVMRLFTYSALEQISHVERLWIRC